jgi:hypothetical protein
VLVFVDKQIKGMVVAFLHSFNQQLINLCFAHARTLRLSPLGLPDRLAGLIPATGVFPPARAIPNIQFGQACLFLA